MSGEFRFTFGGVDDQAFKLDFERLELLQIECQAGPERILDRLMSKDWLVGDVTNVIRLGLMGAGVPDIEAAKKVRSYVKDHTPSLADSRLLAANILTASIFPPVGEEAPEK